MLFFIFYYLVAFMNMFSKRILIFLFLFFLGTIVYANEAYKVKYLGSSQGLSNNSVRCIFQDSRGFMWLGTYDGLDRYDGYDFKILRNRINDSTSLPHNYISAINEDDAHNLWVGMGHGVVQYNQLINQFTPIVYQEYNTRNTRRLSIYTNCIEKDTQGNMFIGTSGLGLIIKFKNRDVAVQIPLMNGKIGNVSVAVQGIHIDEQQRAWVFISGRGLYQYNYKANRLDAVNNSISYISVNKMLADGRGNLWLGTSAGLLKYSITKNRVEENYTPLQNRLSAAYVTALSLDKNEELWIGTDGGGIDILNLATNKIENIEKRGVSDSLSSESVLSIFIDKESRKWIGTNKGGINIIDISGNDFKTIRKGAGYAGLPNNFITSFFENKDDNTLWIGTDGGGISVWNIAQNKFTNYKKPLLSSNIISSINRGPDNNIWVTTYGGGVNRFAANGSVEYYKLINDAIGSENKIAINSFSDSKGQLWITTYENGYLYLFDKSENRFKVFDQRLTDIMSIKEDKHHVLWGGNSHQIIKIDRVNKAHQYFEIGKTVRAIYEDKKDNFWIGAEGGGLILFDRSKGEIKERFSEDEGLSSNTVMQILEDETGDLWISTSNGLNKFNPQTKKFNTFYESDGLQNNQFSYRAALKLHTGEMVFGGNNGFNLFTPSEVKVRNYFPRIVITSLRINNKDINAGVNYETDSLGYLSRLEIPHKDAILSLQFAALEYSVADKIQYAYYLEGWDKDWNMSGRSRTVTYNNIREGSYTLRIKSTNAEGVWNDKETTLKIKILPPWYRSWWAYLLYASTIGVIIFLYSRYKAAQQKMQYELKLARVNEEVRRVELESERMEKEVQRAELEKTHAQYEREKAQRETERVINEREKDINQKRLSFFTNISHEFRTPLTMIINPVQELISRYQGKEKEELRIIGLNANRLLSLTDQLLLFRKIEEGAEGLKLSRFNFSHLCNTVFHYFKHEAKTRNIYYSIEGIEAPIELYGDKNKIEIILYNLIANAFKYTPKAGNISIKIKTEGSFVKTIVEDSGAGIPAGTGNAIFERFYQAQGHVKLGFGIGLYMVKQFTDMHYGSISYQSELGKGTVFMLELPLGKAHFTDLPIDDESFIDDGALIKSDILNGVDEEAAAEIPKIPVLTSQKAVLVVDDDEEMRNYVAAIFSDNNLVYKASNGAEALRIAQEQKPDLIISDITMPVMDGIEFCKAVKNDTNINHLPVILLTAHTSQEVELKGTEEGADYYITKPFSKELLLARVNSIFKTRQNLQQYFYDQVTLKDAVSDDPKVSPEYQELLDNCIAVVEKHLDNPDFNIEMLAREMAMSHSYLYKRIKLISGQSVNSFIRFLRLRKAAELLISTNDTVTDVAYKVGFSDVKYFREQFAKIFKMKPTEYIKQYRGKMSEKIRIDKPPNTV